MSFSWFRMSLSFSALMMSWSDLYDLEDLEEPGDFGVRFLLLGLPVGLSGMISIGRVGVGCLSSSPRSFMGVVGSSSPSKAVVFIGQVDVDCPSLG